MEEDELNEYKGKKGDRVTIQRWLNPRCKDYYPWTQKEIAELQAPRIGLLISKEADDYDNLFFEVLFTNQEKTYFVYNTGRSSDGVPHLAKAFAGFALGLDPFDVFDGGDYGDGEGPWHYVVTRFEPFHHNNADLGKVCIELMRIHD